jgi:radical SAM protein with 4Fe4S-binding SPASM domain
MNLPADYGVLTQEILSEASSLREPASGVFELTGRCNLACRMCYIRKPLDEHRARSEEISAEEWVNVAREAVDQGMLFLLLTGGEALIRPDFFEIYEPLRSMGIIIALYTNGTLVTEDVARDLSRMPPNSVGVSLYGASETTYEAVTGVQGSFKQCVAGIERLLARGIALHVRSTVCTLNVHELEDMRALASAWGVPFALDPFLSKRRDQARSAVPRIRLSAGTCLDLENKDPIAVGDWCAIQGSTRDEDEGGAYYCSAGKNTFVIGPSGDMNVCIDLPFPGAKPLDIGFSEAWHQVQQFVASTPAASNCRRCNVKGYCGRCPGWSYTETGTLTEPVQFLCDIAQERRRRYSSKVGE